MKRIDVAGPRLSLLRGNLWPPAQDHHRPRRTGCSRPSPDLAVRVAVLRGQQNLAQGDTAAALAEYQKALAINKNSSLVNYRMGELYFNQHNFKSAANSFQDACEATSTPGGPRSGAMSTAA